MILVNRNCDSHSHLIQTDTRVANSRTFKWCCYEITWDATWVEWMWRMWRFGYAKTSMLLGNRWVLVCFSDFGDFRHVLLINDVSWVVFDNFSPRTLSKSYCWTRVRTTTKGCTRKLQGACIESVFIVARCSKALKPTSCATPYDWLVDWLIDCLIDWLTVLLFVICYFPQYGICWRRLVVSPLVNAVAPGLLRPRKAFFPAGSILSQCPWAWWMLLDTFSHLERYSRKEHEKEGDSSHIYI